MIPFRVWHTAALGAAVMLAGVACGSGTSDRAGGRARVGEAAPAFTLSDIDGNPVSLAQFRGKVVFIDFWATWCPPCRMSMPEVEKLHADYQGRPVQVLGLSVDDDRDDVRDFVRGKGVPYPVLLAGASNVPGDFNVRGIPHFVIIDQEGRLAESWSGYAPGFGADWREVIDGLLAV